MPNATKNLQVSTAFPASAKTSEALGAVSPQLDFLELRETIPVFASLSLQEAAQEFAMLEEQEIHVKSELKHLKRKLHGFQAELKGLENEQVYLEDMIQLQTKIYNTLKTSVFTSSAKLLEIRGTIRNAKLELSQLPRRIALIKGKIECFEALRKQARNIDDRISAIYSRIFTKASRAAFPLQTSKLELVLKTKKKLLAIQQKLDTLKATRETIMAVTRKFHPRLVYLQSLPDDDLQSSMEALAHQISGALEDVCSTYPLPPTIASPFRTHGNSSTLVGELQVKVSLQDLLDAFQHQHTLVQDLTARIARIGDVFQHYSGLADQYSQDLETERRNILRKVHLDLQKEKHSAGSDSCDQPPAYHLLCPGYETCTGDEEESLPLSELVRQQTLERLQPRQSGCLN
ncbi:hypothetical protein HDV03_004909 [Kappamyces sp. JEL0829]|nr:hypothetical protein HDV03_004909 [Kappamyces sp. JEL0829]